jgi:hypothetical protein
MTGHRPAGQARCVGPQQASHCRDTTAPTTTPPPEPPQRASGATTRHHPGPPQRHHGEPQGATTRPPPRRCGEAPGRPPKGSRRTPVLSTTPEAWAVAVAALLVHSTGPTLGCHPAGLHWPEFRLPRLGARSPCPRHCRDYRRTNTGSRHASANPTRPLHAATLIGQAPPAEGSKGMTFSRFACLYNRTALGE